MRYFSIPNNGDIVWCKFPETLGKPGPKPRPALIIAIGANAQNKPVVTVVYGTTKKLERLYLSEFKIERADGASFKLSGLAADTKFDFNHQVKLPYCSTWFDVAPGQAVTNQPKLGVLAPDLVLMAKQAFDKSSKR
jgi:mRNA-degrading endonuclease toxin of MazEF toxin-antitoxin module